MILYRVSKSSVLEAVRLVYDPGTERHPGGDSVAFVVADPDLRMMVVGIPNLAPTHFEMVNTAAPWTRDSFELGEADRFVTHPLLFVRPEKGPLLLFDWFGVNEFSEELVAFDVSNKQREPLKWQAYRDAHITGGTRGYQFTDDWQYLQQFEDGRLAIRKGGYAVEFAPPLPPALRFQSDEGPELYLNNEHLLAVTRGEYQPKSPNGLGKLTYRIYDKAGGTWKSLTVPGNLTKSLRAFGPWIAGMVNEGAGNERPGVTSALKPPRVSPGRAERSQENRATGMPIDIWLEGFYYRPGILFLYHVPTARYYQWDTHQGDSEILLVEKDQVYYRVNRTIYRAVIGEKAVGKPTLVVAGDEVPDIHWIFFGPKLPPDYKLPPKVVAKLKLGGAGSPVSPSSGFGGNGRGAHADVGPVERHQSALDLQQLWDRDFAGHDSKPVYK